MQSSANFVKGLCVPFRGFYLIMTSLQLFMLAIVPLLLAMSLGLYLLFALWSSSTPFLTMLAEWLPWIDGFMKFRMGGVSFFEVLFQAVFWVFLILFTIYFSYLVLTILGAPFYSLIVDKILVRRGIQPPVQNNLLRWLYTTVKMLIINVLKLVVFMAATGLLFVMSFWSLGIMIVPLCVGCMIAYDCMDFSLECMNYSLRARWKYFSDHLSFFAGLVLVILLFSFIPGLFTISLPFFIAGGADAFASIAQSEAAT